MLEDPANDRQVPNIPLPPLRPLEPEKIFPVKNKYRPDWKVIKDHLQKEGRIEKEQIIKLIKLTNKILKSEPNVIQISDPVTIVGDIHGQYYDLIKALEVGGNPETQKYIFLGDYVNRGSFSIEVLILLYSLKVNFPKNFFMLRGNHECRQLTSFFNFYDECRYKYDQELYEILLDSFTNMPLACIINGQFIAMHGGLSPELHTVEDINFIERYKEPPDSGLFCDLLWSDPVDNDDGICEGAFRANDVRGCSYYYSQESALTFLERNCLLSIIRAHEAQLDGYKMHRWGGTFEFPMVITVFSAPNYCDQYNNKAAVIKLENNIVNIQQFVHSKHPYLLPNFMDVFSWSIPFVAEKINEILIHLIKQKDSQFASDDEVQQEDIQKFQSMIQNNDQEKSIIYNLKQIQEQDRIKSKLKFVSKLMKLQRVQRIENENIVQLNTQSTEKKQLKGVIENTISIFNKAKKADRVNEQKPP